MLAAVAAPLTGGRIAADLSGYRALRYRLRLPADIAFRLDGDRQRLENDVLEVRRETLPAADAQSCDGPPAALAATPYVQSAAPAIVALAKTISGTADGDLARVQALAAWVFDNLEKRPVVGLPDALATLKNRRGDCNEHAALFAALARSLGIPTRIAAGVVFYNGAFYYHAWNEVCLDNRWISLDTTRNQLPADITHIKFVDGESAELLKIASLLGKLAIEVLDEPDQNRQSHQTVR